MRAVQFRILKEILEQIAIPGYIHAFEKGRSIPMMAKAHVEKGLVISIDLKDFFTSIRQYHLFQIFQHLGFGDAPARTLSELCTYGMFVPQGALTSPKLSNIVTALTFGPIIKEYCERHGYTVTIYADDITISTDEDLIKQRGMGAVEEILQFVSDTVQSFGFKVNRRKTKLMRPFQRQYVCGVVVNRMTNLQKTERRKLRAMVYNVQRNGLDSEGAKSSLTPDAFKSRLMGQLNWFGQLNPEAGARLLSTLRQAVEEQGQPNAGAEEVKEIVSSDSPTTVPETPSAAESPWC
jgi:RNA-directed DNA polymerase